MFLKKYPIESNPKHKVGFNKFSDAMGKLDLVLYDIQLFQILNNNKYNLPY